MDGLFFNDHNYVRADTLALLSVESLSLLLAIGCFTWLALAKLANLEGAFFLALPFSDVVFRIGPVQPVELIGMLVVLCNLKSLRITPLMLVAGVFLLFSAISYFTTDFKTPYSFLYSCRFLLTSLVFSCISDKPFPLPRAVMKLAVLLTFIPTMLQIALWTIGLPIDGIFYNGFIPRAKGLAHEPATWSIWIISLLPYVLHFRLGPVYLALTIVTLMATFSTFGLVAALAFVWFRFLCSPTGSMLKQSRAWMLAACALLATGGLIWIADVELPSQSTSILDKLVHYTHEFTDFVGLTHSSSLYDDGASGRGGDFILFGEFFPSHWLLGIGSFNCGQIISNRTDFVPATNTYVTMLLETGVVGSTAILALLFFHYRTLFRFRGQQNVDFWALSLDLFVMIAGIRCWGFHELWYAQASGLRIGRANQPTAKARQQIRSRVSPSHMRRPAAGMRVGPPALAKHLVP